jgi:protoporphyrinogen IX oxidase
MIWFNLLLGLHILAVIAWMAGLLYLPRLFIYHIKHADQPTVTEVFKVMERNLLRMIMTPAMMAAWLFGLGLVAFHVVTMERWTFFAEPWFDIKFLGIIGLTGYHHFLASRFKKLQAGQSIGSESFWRKINEVPFVLAIIIVLSVTLKYGEH